MSSYDLSDINSSSVLNVSPNLLINLSPKSIIGQKSTYTLKHKNYYLRHKETINSKRRIKYNNKANSINSKLDNSNQINSKANNKVKNKSNNQKEYKSTNMFLTNPFILDIGKEDHNELLLPKNLIPIRKQSRFGDSLRMYAQVPFRHGNTKRLRINKHYSDILTLLSHHEYLQFSEFNPEKMKYRTEWVKRARARFKVMRISSPSKIRL